jgi:hypothetical protein
MKSHDASHYSTKNKYDSGAKNLTKINSFFFQHICDALRFTLGLYMLLAAFPGGTPIYDT